MTEQEKDNFHPVIFTDLDGTLLDHKTYDYSPAQPALDFIARHKIPLILSSSKTVSEIKSLQKQLQIDFPAIVENGGGVSIPENYFDKPISSPPPGKNVSEIKEALSTLPAELAGNFSGFTDWSVEKIAEQTGLPLEAAALAAERSWSVPGLWSGTEQDFTVFISQMQEQGIQVTQGGRFIHLMGQTSKGIMLQWLMASFRRENPEKTLVSIALGDAPNDQMMLEAADHAIVIPNLSGKTLQLDPKNISGVVHYADLPGPAGWNSTVLPILKSMNM